jgi:hypothetical protein
MEVEAQAEGTMQLTLSSSFGAAVVNCEGKRVGRRTYLMKSGRNVG